MLWGPRRPPRGVMPRLILVRQPTILRELEHSSFRREGFDLVPMSNVDEVLRRAETDGADLVIAPVDRHDTSSADLCLALQRSANASIPILLTGSADERQQALELGARRFLSAPWTRSELIGTIRSFFPHEERSSLRAAVSMKVLCGQGSESYVAFTKDISATGLFLKGVSLADPGSRIRLRLRLPTERGEDEIDLEGEVVRRVAQQGEARSDAGVGVQFLDFSMTRKLPIARFVREHGGE